MSRFAHPIFRSSHTRWLARCIATCATLCTILASVGLTTAAAADPTMRINAGGNAVALSGMTWSADTDFVGGQSTSNLSVADIAGTTSDELFKRQRTATARLGGFAYAIPAPTAGTYEVTLDFAEIYFGATAGGPAGAGRRVFSVNFEGGAPELEAFDIYEAVGAMAAITKTFWVTVSDGTMNIDFAATVDRPTVAAITVVSPAGDAVPSPSSSPVPALTSAFAWRPGAPSPTARSEAQGAAVGGKVYAFGGFASGTTATTASNVYDTVTNSWSSIPSFPVLLSHSATIVDGDTIWFVGGYVGSDPGGATSKVWKYDTKTRRYSTGPSLPAPRGAGAVAVIGRELHFFGGTNRVAGSWNDPDQGDHWVVSLDGGTGWISRAPLPNPRNHLAGAAVGGVVYAIGGQHGRNEDTGLQTDVHRYDPQTNTWTSMPGLPRARSHVSALVRDRQILVIGGTNPGAGSSRDVTSFDPGSKVWSNLPPLPGGRKGPVTGLVNDVIWVSGGSLSTSIYSGQFANRWETGPAMPVALGEVAGGMIGRTLYLFGEGSTATLALDVGTGVWRSNLAVRPYPGSHHAAEVVGGELYLFGGIGSSAGKVQIYNPQSNSWRLGPNVPFAAGSSASAVIDGRVYVAGGISGQTTTGRAAVYDPTTRVWSSIAPMPVGRNHSASVSDGSRFWVIGGRGAGSGANNSVANGFDTVQVFNPATNTWSSSSQPDSGLAPLPQARGGMGKGAIVDGEIYVMGGETVDGAGATSEHVYTRVDIYDPAANTWRTGAPMLTGKHGIFPVAIGNRITVSGGGVRAGYSASSSTQTYTTSSG